MERNIHLLNFVSETADTCIDVMEPVLFTNLSEKMVRKAKPSEIEPVLAVAGLEWGLTLKRLKHFNQAKRVLISYAKHN